MQLEEANSSGNQTVIDHAHKTLNMTKDEEHAAKEELALAEEYHSAVEELMGAAVTKWAAEKAVEKALEDKAIADMGNNAGRSTGS